MRHIAVIGGGIAGLTVALRRANQGDRVTVFEAAPKVGGQLSSEARAGLLIEHGAEGFVARSEVVPALAADAGIADHVVDQLEQRSFRFADGQLLELAPGEAGRLLGFQVPSDELGRGIRSFVYGMGELPERLALALRDRITLHLNARVTRVVPHGSGVRLSDAHGESAEFSSAVVATTARDAAGLLSAAFGHRAEQLRASTQLSSLTVSLSFPRESIAHPLDGTGFIVPEPEQLGGLRAVTFTSSKLPHRAPAGRALLRLFFRPTDHDLEGVSDAEWVDRAVHSLAMALPLSAAAEEAIVSRWPHALPVFDDAHRARVTELSGALSGQHIWLAGAAFHGSGIDAAIRSGESAAKALAE